MLFRSIRGTSNLESLHQHLIMSFGYTIAGPWYSEVLLSVVRHFYNWRMSIKNSPNYPSLTHHDGLLIDRIHHLYELIFGHPKHRDWTSFNENLPTMAAYGILPVNEAHTSSIKTLSDDDIKTFLDRSTLKYVAIRQTSSLSFLPTRGIREKRLIHRKLNQAIANEESLHNLSIFERLNADWIANFVSLPLKIYPKLPTHFARYVKGWRKNQDHRDAEIASGANRLSGALEYVPNTGTIIHKVSGVVFLHELEPFLMIILVHLLDLDTLLSKSLSNKTFCHGGKLGNALRIQLGHTHLTFNFFSDLFL